MFGGGGGVDGEAKRSEVGTVRQLAWDLLDTAATTNLTMELEELRPGAVASEATTTLTTKQPRLGEVCITMTGQESFSAHSVATPSSHDPPLKKPGQVEWKSRKQTNVKTRRTGVD